MFLTISNVKCK